MTDGGTRTTQEVHPLRCAGETELMRKHHRLAEAIAHLYFLPGADHADVQQEAMCGLLAAARDYNPHLGVPFRRFAALVIERHLQDRVTNANRGKHLILTDALRGDTQGADDGDPLAILDTLQAPNTDPYEQLAIRDELRAIAAAAKKLSPLERHALTGILNGTPYIELGDAKSIDNAAVRAREKLRRAA